MKGKTKKWRQSFLCEYWSEGAWPWIVGMGYKAVRTEKYKYIHWTHHLHTPRARRPRRRQHLHHLPRSPGPARPKTSI